MRPPSWPQAPRSREHWPWAIRCDGARGSGANVLRIARRSHLGASAPNPVLGRARTATLKLDLKSDADTQRLLALVDCADAMIEGFRPGVMERMGLGPERCLSRNPRLVYGRVTGWGRSGPLAQTAGHDINYIAITGALHACGTADSGPIPPLNLVGDFGGGGLMLAFGVVCALLEARNSGRGQVVDVSMTGGAALLMSMIYGMRASGRWPAERAGNILDGSAYFYTCYRTADDDWMAVGAIEPEFRLQLLQLLGLGSMLTRSWRRLMTTSGYALDWYRYSGHELELSGSRCLTARMLA